MALMGFEPFLQFGENVSEQMVALCRRMCCWWRSEVIAKSWMMPTAC